MANKSISELSTISSYSSLLDSDLLVLQHNNQAMSLKVGTLENWLAALADGHGGIKSISMDSSYKLTITYTDGTSWSTSAMANAVSNAASSASSAKTAATNAASSATSANTAATNAATSAEMAQEIADSMLYTNSTPTLTSHGGVAVGETFDKVSMQDMFDKILYPWVAPSVSISITGITSGAVYEKGVTKAVTACVYTVTKKSHYLTSVILYKTVSGTQTAITTIYSGTNGDSMSGTYSFSLDVTENTSFVMKATDANSKTTSSNTVSVTFVYPYYWGVVDSDTTIDENTVLGLTKSVSSKGAKSVSYTADNSKMVFAYPSSYGSLGKITDPNNFDVTDTFTQTTLSVTGTDGTAQSYYVYTADTASTVSGFTMKFSY